MSSRSVVALFPRSSRGQRGGIEQSARLARAALEAGPNLDSLAFEIGPTPSSIGPSWKMGAALSLLAAGAKRSDLLLAWHASFLKLLPFVRRRPKRTVTFLHGKEVWGDLPQLVLDGLSSADLLLSNSVHTWERFVDKHPAYRDRPHRTVHLGIGEPITDKGVPPQTPASAVMLGRLHRDEDYKGHREVIEVWPSLLDRVPDARLIIIGEGGLLPDLQQRVRFLGLEEWITFEGGVDEATKNRLLAAASCLVLPSRGEGFGLVYLEAMRLGRPCLVSDSDAGKEVVGPAGVAVDPTNSAALVEGLELLMGPGAGWEALSRSAQARYESDFTASAFQRRLMEVLEEVL